MNRRKREAQRETARERQRLHRDMVEQFNMAEHRITADLLRSIGSTIKLAELRNNLRRDRAKMLLEMEFDQ